MLGAGGFVRVLVIDTCGEVGSVALCNGELVVAAEMLVARGSSSALLPAVARLLAVQGWGLAELDGVGVVSGPGSFTGVRVGLAAAKGLCEAAGLPLAAVSRLEVLADAAGLQDGCAVLDAGRGEIYLRVVAAGKEMLCGLDEARGIAAGGRVVVAEERMLEAFAGMQVEVVALRAELAPPVVLRELRAGAGDAALIDANYVRGERDIYGKSRVAVSGESV
jgi:tRNA threonylcarbamoyladenosine biosynthesis protein TsaB